ncbi:MAG: HAMP domain-containing protein [Chlorobi bacterium]|nr:HAMP domain-containing protein [Chlorobiota bacterium]
MTLAKKIQITTATVIPFGFLMIQLPFCIFILGINDHHTWFWVGVMSASGSLVSIPLAYTIIQWIAKPLRNLRETAEKFSSGNYQARSNIQSKDEMGLLAATLNQMAEDLALREKILSEKERKISVLWNAIQHSTEGIALIDKNLNILQANHAFGRMFDSSVLDLVEHSFTSLRFPENVGKEIEKKMREGEPWAEEVEIPHPDGTVQICYLSATPVETKNVREGWLVVVIDNTQRRKLEKEMRRKEHLAAIGGFLTMISHELRNPLTSIKMNIDILTSRVVEDNNTQKYVRILRRELNRLENLVRDILAYARPVRLEIQPIDVDQLIERTLDVLFPVLERSEIEVVVHNSQPKTRIAVDPDLIQQVLINVVQNAVESMENGTLTISVTPEPMTNAVTIRVADQGCGIEKEYVDHIFDPFFSKKNNGSGLGLAISKKLVEAHGGTISATSEPSVGTEVTIWLPRMII